MTLEQLLGKYSRLRAELSGAYEARAWDTSYINRLSDEIAATERALVRTQPADEQTSDSLPGLFL